MIVVDTYPTTCDDCRGAFPADEVIDCGSHTYCGECLMTSPCPECKRIRAEMAQDWADERRAG